MPYQENKIQSRRGFLTHAVYYVFAAKNARQ